MALGIIGLLSNPERARRIEGWIEQIIRDIKEVEGVQGVFLLNPQGELLYPFHPADHPLSGRIMEAAKDIIQALALFELTGNPIQELKLSYSKGALLVYDRLGLQVKTARGVEEASLVIPCHQSINRPHLRMVMKVAVTEVQNHQKGARGRASTANKKYAGLDRTEVDPALHKLLDTIRGAAPAPVGQQSAVS